LDGLGDPRIGVESGDANGISFVGGPLLCRNIRRFMCVEQRATQLVERAINRKRVPRTATTVAGASTFMILEIDSLCVPLIILGFQHYARVV
jgi:hypothetical protein